MYEFHAWVGLAEDPYESNTEVENEVVSRLRRRIEEGGEWSSASFQIRSFNGQWFLSAQGHPNHRRGRSEPEFLDELLHIIVTELPGSWGVVYDRDDEFLPAPWLGDHFRVRVIARGRITEQLDPFLSPIVPTIEDPEPGD